MGPGLSPSNAPALSRRLGASGGPGGRPRAYVCYLCGQQYGSQSLLIHIPQCQKKLEEKNARLPEAERRAPPPEPVELQQPLPTKPEVRPWITA